MPTSLQAGYGRAEGRPGKSANPYRSTLNNELIFLLGLALDRLDVADAAACPISERTKAALAAAKRRGVKFRRWLDEIAAGIITDVGQIAARENCSVRKVNMTISLAFLAPDLVK